MIVALTGATGFLGRRVARGALARGWEVRALVHAEGGGRVIDGVTTVLGSLSDERLAPRLLEGAEALLHLAAVGVQSRDRDWDQAAEVNVSRTLRWLQLARGAGVRRAVITGTCLEYTGFGALPDDPWPSAVAPRCAEDAATESADPYGATKAAGGVIARAWARAASFGLWYLRLASLYGEGDDPAKLLPRCARALAAGSRVELAPGEQVREWLHVDDAAEAVLDAAERSVDGARVVNVGTGEGRSLRQVTERLAALGGRDRGLLRFGARGYRPHEAHHLVMDVTLAGQLLGWRPRVGLDEGLAPLLRAA